MSPTTLAEAVAALAAVGILYPFTIYPLILLLLSSKKQTAPSPLHVESLPPFSIVIPAHNEEAVIGAKLRNTLEAANRTAAEWQIVVAADGCTDQTCEIVRQFAPQVELVEVEPRGGITGALRTGSDMAIHDIVFFTDSDILLDRDSFVLMLRHFVDPTVGGVCGSTRLIVQKTSGLELEKLNVLYRRWIRHRQSLAYSSIGADGANWALRKDLAEFPASPQLAEDLVMPMSVLRKGYRFIYEPAAGALEVSPKSVMDEYHRKVRTIAGGLQAASYCRWMFSRKHLPTAFHFVSWKLAKYAVPLWVIILLGAGVMLLGSTGYGRAALIGVSGFLSLALVGGLLRLLSPGRVPRVPSYAWYALVALATPIAAAFNVLMGKIEVNWRMAAR